MATASSQVMNLSCLPSIVEIIKAQSTLRYEAEPYIAALVSSVVNIFYAIAAGRSTVITSTAISSSVNGAYFLVHRRYNKNGNALVKQLLYRVVIALGMLATIPVLTWPFCSANRHQKISLTWFGIMQMCASVSVSFAQLLRLREIIETKNAASISPHLTFGTSCSVFFWGIYSFMVGDFFYIVGTLAGIVSVSLQVYLLLKYPRVLDVKKEEVESGETSVSPSRVELTVVGKSENDVKH